MNLSDIARNQQDIVNRGSGRKANGRNTGIPFGTGANVDPETLYKGSDSFNSSPLIPPWVQMPDGGIPFSSNGTIPLPIMGSGFVDVIGPAGQYVMQVPNGYDGVIEDLVCFFNGGGFISGSGALIWRILIDGQAARNYDNILVQLGVTPFNGKTRLRIKSNQTIQFQVNNVGLGGGANQIFCQFVGYYYPCKLS